MGSAVSAEAADRQVKNKARRRQRQRRRHRRHQLLEQLPKTDEQGNPLYYDKYGNQFFYDDKQRSYYLDDQRQRLYIDDDGNLCYLDKNGVPFYADEQGKTYYKHENRGPFYPTETCSGLSSQTYYYTNKDAAANDNNVDSDRNTAADPHSPSLTEVFGIKATMNETPGSSTTANSSFVLSQGSSSSVPTVEVFNYRTLTAQPFSMLAENNISTMTNKSSSEPRTATPLQHQELSYTNQYINREVLHTPEYVKDRSFGVELQRIAQTDAENKVLEKLLQQEENREQLAKAKNFRKVGVFDVKIKDDKYDSIICGSGFLPNGNVIFVDKANKTLKLFNTELEFLASFSLDICPQNLCCGEKDSLVHITFSSQMVHGIKVFEVKEASFIEKETIKIAAKIGAIARRKDALAIITKSLLDYEQNNPYILQMTNVHGHCLKDFKLQSDEQNIVSAESVVISEHLQFLISDTASNCVYCFNTEGEMVFKYQQLRQPTGICVDNKGSFFATSPGIVHQVSASGERIRALMKRESIGFCSTHICYDNEDGLMVLSGKSNIMTAFLITDSV